MFGECHAHIFMNGTDYKKAVHTHKKAPCEAVIREHLRAYQTCGITYVRDGGDHYRASVLARKLAEEYGITYRTPVFAIHKNGHYGKIVGYGFDDLKEYRALVQKAVWEGADFIKIMTTGLLDFDDHGRVTGEALTRKEVFEMVDIAHAAGMAVMTHTNGNQAVIDVLEAGADSLEHGNYMEAEAVHALAESGAVWVPTTVTVRNLLGDGRFSDEVLRPICEKTAENLRLAKKLGAAAALGSDAGAYRVPHGQGLLDEYEAFREIFGEKENLNAWLRDGENRLKERF